MHDRIHSGRWVIFVSVYLHSLDGLLAAPWGQDSNLHEQCENWSTWQVSGPVKQGE